MSESMNSEKKAPRFSLRPALPKENPLFFALPVEKDLGLGTIGHVRIDVGCRG